MRRAIFVLIALLVSVPSVFGTDFYWTGAAGNGNWFDENNWAPKKVPYSGDNVIIQNNTPPCVISNNFAAANTINIAQGATLITSNSTIFADKIQNFGKIEIQGNVEIRSYNNTFVNHATGQIEGQALKVTNLGAFSTNTFENSGNIAVDKFGFDGNEVWLKENSVIKANEVNVTATYGFFSNGGKVDGNTGTSNTGGSIHIVTDKLILQNGAAIIAGNGTTGNGGNIYIGGSKVVDIQNKDCVIRAGNSSSGTGGNVDITTGDINNNGKILAGQGPLGNGKINTTAYKQFLNKGNMGTTSGTLGKIARPQQHTLCNVTIKADTVLIAPEAGGMIMADTLIVFGRMVNVAIKSGVGIGLRSGVEFRTTVDGILDFTETTYWQPISGGFFKRIFSNRVIPSEQWRLQGIFGGPVSVFPADTNLLDAHATIADVTGLAGTIDTLRLRLQNLSTTAQSLRYFVSSKLGWVLALQAGTDKMAPFAEGSVDIFYAIPPGTARGTVDTVGVVVSIGTSFADTTYSTITCLSRSAQPWTVARIAVEPAEVTLSLGQQQPFTAVGMNADDDTLYFEPVWSADGGTIDSTGLFTATQSGNFVVTCTDTSSGVSGRAVVHVGATGVQTDRILLPQAFALKQNYPNPFNPVTTIEYHVKENCEVTLTLYDVRGKQMAILAKGLHQAGIYNVRFDAGELPAGIYFYRIRMQDYQAVRKMVLMK